MTALNFLIAALATFRLSLLFTRESGPSGIFAKLRRLPPRKSAAADWISCIYCFSMTASALVCGALWWSGLEQHVAKWFLLWCALSSAAIVLHQKVTKGTL